MKIFLQVLILLLALLALLLCGGCGLALHTGGHTHTHNEDCAPCICECGPVG